MNTHRPQTTQEQQRTRAKEAYEAEKTSRAREMSLLIEEAEKKRKKISR